MINDNSLDVQIVDRPWPISMSKTSFQYFHSVFSL